MADLDGSPGIHPVGYQFASFCNLPQLDDINMVFLSPQAFVLSLSVPSLPTFDRPSKDCDRLPT
jgi:hypothetical protein